MSNETENTTDENTTDENTTDNANMTDEVKFALWFLDNADFGPAHEDVMELYAQQFEKETGIHIDLYGE